MPKKHIRDEVITLALAGHETTANALAWAFQLAAEHPDKQEALRQDLQHESNALPPHHWQKIPLLKNWMLETMRLYPSAYLLSRTCGQQTEVSGVSFLPGDIVNISIWSIHRNGGNWPEPLRFRPERFEGVHWPSTVGRYLPFGIGRRRCIGSEFAMIEASLVFGSVLKQFQFDLVAGQKRPEPLGLVTLRSKNPMQLVIRPAESSLPLSHGTAV